MAIGMDDLNSDHPEGLGAEAAEDPNSDHPVMADEVQATPAAKAVAKDAGVDLATVPGTGKDGTVVKADVEAVTPKTP